MKVFMVGCATYEGDAVSMEAFLTEDEAQDYMNEQFEYYKKESEEDYGEIEYGCHGREAYVDTDNEERSYKWQILGYDIKATPPAILNALRDSMRDDIERRAEAIVSGYGSARKAVIDLREEKFKKLSFGNCEQLVKVEAFIGLIGLAVVVRGSDGELHNGIVDFDAMDTDELLELHTIITNFQHPTRACNPFWFTDKEWHAVLMDILDQTEEEYQEFISNNPKNKKK